MMLLLGGVVGGSCFSVFPAHGLSRTSCTLCGCLCGGGCDGVVVWELYSGREHLVRRDEWLVILWVAGSFVLSCISNFL